MSARRVSITSKFKIPVKGFARVIEVKTEFVAVDRYRFFTSELYLFDKIFY
jgi:hypothetical protein